MSNIKKNKLCSGVTLIEIIISIAILGIVLITFLSTFTFSFTQITQAGHRSKAVFKTQKSTDQKISSLPISADTIVSELPIVITVQLPSTLITLEQEGKIVTVITDSNGKASEVKTFIP